MSLFNFFRKRTPTIGLPQLCYDVAYFILPHYAYEELSKIEKLCRETPESAGAFFYAMACVARKNEPERVAAQQFNWHQRVLGEEHRCFVLEYPIPPVIDLSEMSPEQVIGSKNPPVLAPHFSAIVHNTCSGEVGYFVLGQAPFGGGTTLRTLLRDGTNCNLGPGPEPQLSAFLETIRGRMEAT